MDPRRKSKHFHGNRGPDRSPENTNAGEKGPNTEESDVFARRRSAGAIVSDVTYNITLGLVLCWGLLANWMMVKLIPATSITGIDPPSFFIGYFVSCFFGVYLYHRSTNPIVSFIGFNFVVLPFGLVVDNIVGGFDSSFVLDAVRITGMVTFVMMLLGSMYPRFFQKISSALAISLLVVIVVELGEMFLFGIHHGIIDGAVVLIFCGYIGYDWGRANTIPKTLDNAVDSAAALYMDIINLFLRILRILARR